MILIILWNYLSKLMMKNYNILNDMIVFNQLKKYNNRG